MPQKLLESSFHMMNVPLPDFVKHQLQEPRILEQSDSKVLYGERDGIRALETVHPFSAYGWTAGEALRT